MSLDENKGNSPYRDSKASRSKVNVDTWTNLGTSSKWRCKICFQQTRLQIKEVNNKKQGWCHSCNTTFDISEVRDVETGDKKYVAKYGTASGQSRSFILSKDRRKKSTGSINDNLSDEDREDLQNAGFSGASFKDYFPS